MARATTRAATEDTLAVAPPTISHRLDAIMAQVAPCDVLIDVGCDHGKLCDQLLQCDRVQHAIATDISHESLNKARVLLSKYGARHQCFLADGLTFQRNDGFLAPVTVTISGMGGLAIIKILESGAIDIGTLIVQPQNKIPEVRAYLTSHGYSIVADICVLDDDRFYDVLKAIPSTKRTELSEIQLEWGVYYTTWNDNLAQKANRLKQEILSYSKLSSQAQARLKLCEEVIWAQQSARS